MNNTKKGLLGIVAFIVFMLVVSLGYQLITKNYNGAANVNQSNTTEQAAGDFKVKDSEGNIVSLSDFKGKPVVVNFWASWCPPCKQEMPYFNEVYKELGSEVQFMMIDIVDGSRETENTAKAFIKDNEYVFPIFFDSDQSAAIANSIYSIPTTIFIDKDGNIVGTHTGAFTKSDLLAEIDKIR
ncbi:MAG: TlpA disulfide reductase family protein [Firmicutes bacterium]|nr:TlpA disulfide reductase family protein [Bacillota bacterium]